MVTEPFGAESDAVGADHLDDEFYGGLRGQYPLHEIGRFQTVPSIALIGFLKVTLEDELPSIVVLRIYCYHLDTHLESQNRVEVLGEEVGTVGVYSHPAFPRSGEDFMRDVFDFGLEPGAAGACVLDTAGELLALGRFVDPCEGSEELHFGDFPGHQVHFVYADMSFQDYSVQQTFQCRVCCFGFVDDEDFVPEVFEHNRRHLVPSHRLAISFD